MTQIYKLMDAVRDRLRANPACYTVSTGDIWEIDLEKTTPFPLAHININSVRFDRNTMVFTLQMLCLDIVDENKDLEQDDVFYGNDNLNDVHNTQLQVVADVVNALRRGELYSDRIQLLSEPSADKVQERFGNMLAGWAIDIEISMPNEISQC